MKNIRAALCAALLIPAIFLPASVSRAQSTMDASSTGILLCSRPWRFLSSWWFALRVFHRDYTFTTVGNDKEHGTWAISAGTIVLTFADGHKDLLTLPLNPLGTDGQDKDGGHFTATIGRPLAIGASSPLGSSSSLSLNAPHSKSTPSALDSLGPSVPTAAEQRKNAPIIALLVSAPWKITGPGWVRVRSFAANGVFETENTPSEHGTWKISDTSITLTFPDGHTDTLTLPLDPKGTDGADENGVPVLAILQAAPAPNTAPATAPASVPAGPVQAPFGTENQGR